ncbi:hypothetical protein C1645_820166 [Glomus cerebriforme]|uniref:Uncharacterized protein n=1 Tax=Glomus cerebriforme TaxID=658196 RepID=A0A397T3N0_9GLOM|nr:hypothetical protein C1645_820166 [Glomus cerebriforme]
MSTTKSKKRKSNDRSQTHIDDHYENFPTPLGKEDQINKALAKMFVLTETLIIQEISRINLKINRIINEENNMTIAFDKWTNPTGQSIYDYCLITEDRKEYLWYSKDYSNVPHHTGAFLGDEIIKIVDNIGPERLAAVVSDNAPDAHTIRKVGIVYQYFTMSHAPCQFLKDSDCVSFIVRLELAFARVLSKHENDIKNWVKDILHNQNFYENCQIIAFILHPLKVTVGCLESRTSTLADCYIHLLSLAGAIYRMSNQNIQFKNYCIIKFNERFHEFSDNLFLLAFFCILIIMEMELQALALQLFAVSPHSASCECLFSVLGWFYDQRRTKLAADRVEGMCKLHTYYITNAKHELPYYAIDTSENSMREKMINIIVEISDELKVNDFDFLYDENIIDMVIDIEPENEVTVNQNRQTVVLAPECKDFDIEALITKEIDDNEN